MKHPVKHISSAIAHVTLSVAARNAARQLLDSQGEVKGEAFKRTREIYSAFDFKGLRARIDRLIAERQAASKSIGFDDILDLDESKRFDVHRDALSWLEDRCKEKSWKDMPAGLLVAFADLMDAVSNGLAGREPKPAEESDEEPEEDGEAEEAEPEAAAELPEPTPVGAKRRK